MLPKRNRLGSKRLVNRVYQKGQKQSGRFLFLRALPNRLGIGRIAIVVPVSASKKATERNRAKRVLRALISAARLAPQDFIISVKKMPPKAEITSLFRKDLSLWFPDLS